MQFKYNGKVVTVTDGLCGKRVVLDNHSFSKADLFIDLYGFTKPLTEKNIKDMIDGSILEVAGKYPNFLGDLMSMGYIKINADIPNPNKQYRVGDKFTIKVPAGRKTLILSKMTNPYMGKGHCLWALINPMTGERWNGTLATSEKDVLNVDEFSMVTGTKQSYDKFIRDND